MSIKPSIQELVSAGRPFTVTLSTELTFETGAMTVKVGAESRKFRVIPNQPLALAHEVAATPVSPVSVQDWGTAADAGSTVTVSVDGKEDSGNIG